MAIEDGDDLHRTFMPVSMGSARMGRLACFEFTDQDVPSAPDNFVARLPPNLSGEDDLMQALCVHLHLPGYFGFNWNALFDCLRDFHWVKERAVVLVHSDLPVLSPCVWKIYLEVLADCVEDWAPGEDHEFRVVFPATAYGAIEAALMG